MTQSYNHRLATEWQTGVFWRDVVVEFLGTFFLVSVQVGLTLPWSREAEPAPAIQAIQNGLGMAFVLAVLAWSLGGDFGGGHLNPAVSLGMAISLRITVIRALCYMIVQVCGGIAGAGLIYAIVPEDDRSTLGVTRLNDAWDPWQGFLIESWITAILMLTILGSTNQKRKGDLVMYALPIGFALGLGLLVAYSTTGASMNPARSLGPAVVMGKWDDHWIYWAGPFMGSVIATGVYSVLLDIPQYPAGVQSRCD